MADSFTTRNRVRKIETGTRPNTWGVATGTDVIDLFDTALDGWTTKALSGNVTLTSSNGAADEARARVLKFTGAGAYQVTIPSVEKMYVVDNQLTSNLTITTGSGTTAVMATGESAVVICDGTNVKATGVSKSYVDGLVLPTQTGNGGKVLMTSGAAAYWTGGSRDITTDASLVLADNQGQVVHLSASNHTLTVPPTSSVAWPQGTHIRIINNTLGGVLNIAGGSGVTLVNFALGAGITPALAVRGQCDLHYRGSGEAWWVQGYGLS